MNPTAPDPYPEAARLTIGAAASRLGVAVPTLRSWERRYGLGPGPVEPGRHRRYSAADMAVLERFCRLVGEGVAASDAAGSALAGVRGPDSAGRAGGGRTLPVGHAGGGSARGLARCAVRMDAAQVLALLEEAIELAGVLAAWEETIKPALLAVGRKWTETQGRYVEVEHLLSWCVTVALHRARPAPPPSGTASRRIVLACASDEWHSLPLEVLDVALAQYGVPTCMLGAAVPTAALHEAVRRIGPAHVVVWSQTPRTADPAALPVPSGRSRCRVHPAGPGWAGARPAVGGVLLSLGDALEACLG